MGVNVASNKSTYYVYKRKIQLNSIYEIKKSI